MKKRKSPREYNKCCINGKTESLENAAIILIHQKWIGIIMIIIINYISLLSVICKVLTKVTTHISDTAF